MATIRRIAIAATVVALAACSGTGSTTTQPVATPSTAAPGTPTVTTTEPVTTTEAPATTTTALDTTTVPDVIVIDVIVEGGEVDGPGEVEVAAGSDVLLRVTSDVSDEVHLHGYDISVDVEAGNTVELAFTADREGIFEVELEDARLPLLEITVR